jgi:hypothetical protein
MLRLGLQPRQKSNRGVIFLVEVVDCRDSIFCRVLLLSRAELDKFSRRLSRFPQKNRREQAINVLGSSSSHSKELPIEFVSSTYARVVALTLHFCSVSRVPTTHSHSIKVGFTMPNANAGRESARGAMTVVTAQEVASPTFRFANLRGLQRKT